MNSVPTSPTSAGYCGHCGETYDGGANPPSYAHRQCREKLQLEPPRYCRACGRRLKVQVTPTGWSAACSRHGRSDVNGNESSPALEFFY
ncbi:biotin synthase auxiliary protein BsaP [Pseudarthrobacter sp. TAF60_1]|uniref:biotin synthase auxiliary protein BsaP n=1 Tax=Pseudarthrobacter sp. TAF60_1 TaxID=3233071 RepID=UPI003F9E9473